MSVATGTMPDVEPTVQRFLSDFAAAWNNHDPKAIASHFVEDGDLINPAGRVARGRMEIETLFREEFSSRFKTSQMHSTISHIRRLTPEIVIVTHNPEISSLRDRAGNELPTLKPIATFVLRNDRDVWRIVAARPMVPVLEPGK